MALWASVSFSCVDAVSFAACIDFFSFLSSLPIYLRSQIAGCMHVRASI